MRWLIQYPWYTLLIAMYSSMALIAFNVGQVQFDAVLRSLLVILVSVFLLASLVLSLVRDPHKAGVIVSLVLIATDFIKTARGVSDKQYFDGCRGQAIFTRNLILDAVAEIIRKSDPAPIIIIQGDHGPNHAGVKGRMGILNVYYFPEARTEALYPTITPVNSFPVVFNTFLGANYKLRPDISYHSLYKSLEETTTIPNDCKPD